MSAQVHGRNVARTALVSSSETWKINHGDFLFGGRLSPGTPRDRELGVKHGRDEWTESSLQEHFVHELAVPLKFCQRKCPH